MQLSPAVHGTHAPPSQTTLAPHGVPSASAVAVSPQVALPVEQPTLPVWQTLEGTQLAPSTHAPQTPPLHAAFAPHEAPLPTGLPESTQTEVPVAHEVVPV